MFFNQRYLESYQDKFKSGGMAERGLVHTCEPEILLLHMVSFARSSIYGGPYAALEQRLHRLMRFLCCAHHLFFSCPYSYAILKALAQHIFKAHFSADWQQIVDYIVVTNHNRVHSYLARNIFQLTIHTIWRERNARRHGEVPRPASTLIRWIDQHVRNQLSVIRSTGDRRYDQALQAWFASQV